MAFANDCLSSAQIVALSVVDFSQSFALISQDFTADQPGMQ